MTEHDISKALVCPGSCSRYLWSSLKVLAVRNFKGITTHEEDLLVIHPSGAVWVVEVKVSIADLKAEFRDKKAKHSEMLEGRRAVRNYGSFSHQPTKVERFFIAMPLDLLEKAEPLIPDWCGIIVVLFDDTRQSYAKIHRKGKKLPGQRATAEDRQKVYESIYYRHWGAKA
jgi:hypothetical protein